MTTSDSGADPGEIGHDELAEALQSKSCMLVDVREPHEFLAGHVPGSVNHPLSRFDPHRLPADEPIVLICGFGKRSATRSLRRAQRDLPLCVITLAASWAGGARGVNSADGRRALISAPYVDIAGFPACDARRRDLRRRLCVPTIVRAGLRAGRTRDDYLSLSERQSLRVDRERDPSPFRRPDRAHSDS